MSLPFTAARARNAGFAHIAERAPETRFVQFVDGDCELVDGWLEKARGVLDDCTQIAVVCGRCRERFPEQSIYNRLADLEWDSPVGTAQTCGGISMIRADAFRKVNGFNPAIIAAEEDELCLRLRREGWEIRRIDAEMALHDIAMTRYKQWWRRSVRCGHAYAEGCTRHGRAPERHFVQQTRSIILWALIVPLLAFGLVWPTRGASLMMFGSYFYLYWRIRRYGLDRGWSAPNARLYALACVLAKYPMLVGLFVYAFRRLARYPRQVIEYKHAEASASGASFSSSIVTD